MNSTNESLHSGIAVSMMVTVSYSLAVSLPANASVLWLIVRGARLVPDIFYFSLSLEEILVSLCLTWALISTQYRCAPCMEPFAFFCGLFLTARPLFQLLISLECYMGVNRPVLFLHLKPPRYRLTCCIGAWLLIFATCIYYNYTYLNTLHLFTFFVQNLLILLAMFVCLLSVLRTLRRPGPGVHFVHKKSNRTKMRAFKIISVTLASMTVNVLLCTGPIPAQFYMSVETFQLIYTNFTTVSIIIGSMQPLIYLQKSHKILCLQLH